MASPPPFTAELVEIRRNPWIMGVAAAPFALALSFVVAGIVRRLR